MDGPSPAAGWSLSLVLPAFNEEATIGQAIEEADVALGRLAQDYEILVVDDGSQDATAAIVTAASRAHPRVRLLRHAVNRGYGAALRTGFEAACFDRVAFTDADCQFNLADLASLVPLTEQVPLAVGYRLDRQDPWHRRFVSWAYNLLVRALLGTQVRDCDCALKVFRKETLARLLPETSGFFVNTEMLARARQLGYRVAEQGVRHRPRVGGSSTVSLREIPRTLKTLLPFWWSRVLFPGAPPSPATPLPPPTLLPIGHWFRRRGERGRRPQEPSPSPSATFALLLALVAALLFFSRLNTPLLEPEEARYAEIPRQMLEEGRFVVPVLHGQAYLQKPPLLYWLVMGSYQIFGVHDWAARLVPCGAAFLVVLVTYGWGKRIVGARAAFAGALMLCLSARFVYWGRMLTMDTLLCLWVTAALAAAQAAVTGPRLRRGWWLLSAGCCGLGLLTKGPVALVLVAVPVAVYQLLDTRTNRPRWQAWLGYLVTALAVALPWYLAVMWQHPAFAGEFFWTHHVVRFLAPLDHQEPVWFFLPGLVLGMLPWSLLLVPLGRFLGRHSWNTARRRSGALGFFLLAGLWCLVFFSAAGCKRPAYIQPALPPLALALGCYLAAALPFGVRRLELAWVQRQALLAHWATVLVLAVGIGGFFLASFVGLAKLDRVFPVGILMALMMGILILRGPRRHVATAWTLCGVTTFALLLIAEHKILPGYARRFSVRDQVQPHEDRATDPRVSVICFPHRWDSVSFYLRRNDVQVFSNGQHGDLLAELRTRPQTLLFVKSNQVEELTRRLPVSLDFVPSGKQGMVTVGLVRQRLLVAETPRLPLPAVFPGGTRE